MSKTLGNVVTPMDVADVYGADALRYYLLRTSSFGADGNFTWDDFIKRYNSDLANDLGNLLNRSLGMAKKYFGSQIQQGKAEESDELLRKKSEEVQQKLFSAMDYLQGDLAYHQALAAIWEIIAATDKYIDEMAPWTLNKEGKVERLNQVLHNVFNCLRLIGLYLYPFMPTACEKLYVQLNLKLPTTFTEGQAWDLMPAGKHSLGEAVPLFPRIET